MRFIEHIGEHEVVALFLRAEIDSPRFGAAILDLLARHELNRRVVDAPDLSSTGENEIRRELLAEYREYGRNAGLFEGFPQSVSWDRVALDPSELWTVKYIDWDYWIELSGGSRLPRDAAGLIRAGRTVFGEANDGFLEIAQAIASGARLPELILVREGSGSDLVVLEGHARLTGYALAPESVPSELSVVLGSSPQMKSWGLYGHRG